MKTNREHKLLDSFQLRGTPGKLPNKETAFILLLNLGKKKKKKGLEPIFWNQRLLNTHTKKNKRKKREKMAI